MDLSAWLKREFLGNTPQAYLSAALLFLAFLAALLFLRKIALARLKALAGRTATDLDDLLVDLLGKIRAPEILLFAFYAASRGLALHGGLHKALRLAFVTLLTWRAAALARELLAYGLRKSALGAASDPSSASALRNLRFALDALIWVGAGVFVLDNLGVNISTVVAGLGIGGVAVALAAQHILGDLFGSFVIFMDKPFRVGETISVGTLTGTVEHIGIKTTRLRSIDGELLVLSNADLTSSRIRNFGQMARRRVTASLTLPYDTPPAKAASVPAWLREAVEGRPGALFERAHLKGLGPSGLDYELVYHALSADYAAYMDLQQSVSLRVLEKLSGEGLRPAHPTQTVDLRAPS